MSLADGVDAGTGIQDSSPVGQQAGLTQALWVFFSEMKTAIVLLLLLAVVSILGTVIRQGATPEEYVHLYGPRVSTIIAYLGFSSVYSSTLFKLLLALAGANLTVCSINRFGSTWKRTFKQQVSVDARQISKMPRAETLSFGGTVEDAAAKAAAALRSRSYHVVERRGADGMALLATRGRLSLWGPYLTHLSILVIFLGAILGNALGFGGYTTITEGASTSTYFSDTNQAANLGFRVALKKFAIGHDIKHNPTSYRSDLLVYEGDRLALRKTVDVNHPLTYKGVSFFQSDYGLKGMVVKITAPSGETAKLSFNLSTENGPHGKAYSVSGEPFKQVRLGNKTLTVFVHNLLPDYTPKSGASVSFLPINPAARIMVNDRLPGYKGLDAWSNIGWLDARGAARYKGYTLTLDDVVDYTGLQVSRNPGLPIIYVGFGLLLAGVFLSFYVLHRIVRLNVAQHGSGARVVIGATSREDPSVFDADMQRLRSALA